MYKIKRFAKSDGKLSSKELKERSDKAKAMGAGGTLAASLAASGISKDQLSKIMKVEFDPEEAEKLTQSLNKKAEGMGVKVVKDPFFGNSAYVGTGGGKKVRDKIAYLKKKARKGGTMGKISGKLADTLETMSGKGSEVYKNLGKDAIVLGNLNSPAIEAHELGHAANFRGRGKGIGKLAHSNYGLGTWSGAAGAATGWYTGKKAARAEAEGKKTSTWNKVAPAVVPLAFQAPILASEAVASKKGLKMLKEAGASKEAMKAAKKQLGHAYNTYLANSALQTASGLGAHQISKGIELNKIRKARKKEENEEN